MKFLDIVKEIQNLPENEGYLVLVRCGIFFDGIGKDGVILAEEFGINPICIKEKICKCKPRRPFLAEKGRRTPKSSKPTKYSLIFCDSFLRKMTPQIRKKAAQKGRRLKMTA